MSWVAVRRRQASRFGHPDLPSPKQPGICIKQHTTHALDNNDISLQSTPKHLLLVRSHNFSLVGLYVRAKTPLEPLFSSALPQDSGCNLIVSFHPLFHTDSCGDAQSDTVLTCEYCLWVCALPPSYLRTSYGQAHQREAGEVYLCTFRTSHIVCRPMKVGCPDVPLLIRLSAVPKTQLSAARSA